MNKEKNQIDHIVSKLGEKIKTLRTEKNMSLKDLSERSGISAAAIHKIESNGIIPTITTMMKISDALGKKVSHFIEEELEDKDVVLVPAGQMEDSLVRAEEVAAEIPGAFIPHHFANRENPETHRLHTGPEIMEQVPGVIDAFVAGVGTGGTVTGVGEALKKENPDVIIAAVEPEESPILSGGESGAPDIVGIGHGFIPATLDRSIYDEVIRVSTEEARRLTRELAKREGLLVGISSGAACAGALMLAGRLGKGKQVVTMFCDTGERYLSTGLFG